MRVLTDLVCSRCTARLAVVFLLLSGLATVAAAQQYEITVTNLTAAQTFTPVLVATHGENVRLFKLGDPASPELATLAEEGDTAPLTARLNAMPDVGELKTATPVMPGKSITITVERNADFDYISLAAMLIPTNDGFFAINGVRAPKLNPELVLVSPAYDSGSERNDETCASIPGPMYPECGGPGGGGMPSGGEEGFVHIHRGIHGIGDFRPADRDWRNPVASVTIRRIR